ncbi:MAG: F0F1 ATP synthase subunit A [Cyclobacteriaceae bacterium]
MEAPFKSLKNSILKAFFAFLIITTPSIAFADSEGGEGGPLDVSEVILHHVQDDHVWHFADGLVLPLPVIVYSDSLGLEVFSSANFYDADHNIIPYKGYTLDHGHIYLGTSKKAVLDFSITKNVAMLFVNVLLIVFIFLRVAEGYRKNAGKAPSGIQSFMEPIILFVKDEVVKPNIGPRYERYLPYLLTLFFFILFGNLLGLLPGAANLTGNIAVTMALAVFTFLITSFSGNKAYWSHIFWTPGVPLPLRVIILPVEIIGIFTKPFSLMVRLFAAITAGHIVLLSLLCLTFIFHSWGAGIGASIFVIFINLIELLVAGIQAYVFTLFSSLYIGLAVEEHDHH